MHGVGSAAVRKGNAFRAAERVFAHGYIVRDASFATISLLPLPMDRAEV